MTLLRALPPSWRRRILKNVRILGSDSRLARRGIVDYRFEGRRIRVDLADFVGREMYKHGWYERPYIDLIRRHFADPGASFLDVGANVGNYSLALASHFHHVVAFEPHPAVQPQLRLNVERNPALAIKVVASALSSARGERLFYPNPYGNSGASGFEKFREGVAAHPLKTARGDDYASAFCPRVAAIKIDVEGHELEVLDGLQQTLSLYRPLVLLEWLTGAMQSKGGIAALARLLPGYRLFECLPRRAYLVQAKPSARPLPAGPLVLIPLREPLRRKYDLLFCIPEQESGFGGGRHLPLCGANSKASLTPPYAPPAPR